MTPNQWLLFVGVPALFAIVALIADWRRTARRKRIGGTISRRVDVSGTFLHEEPPDLAVAHRTLQSGSPIQGRAIRSGGIGKSNPVNTTAVGLKKGAEKSQWTGRRLVTAAKEPRRSG